ncbi:hypothetical protein TNCV_3834121 [Trichonephila clavipes]|nr:hypothetical protein TNCV_3834121 [Trichonephila clavipes]
MSDGRTKEVFNSREEKISQPMNLKRTYVLNLSAAESCAIKRHDINMITQSCKSAGRINCQMPILQSSWRRCSINVSFSMRVLGLSKVVTPKCLAGPPVDRNRLNVHLCSKSSYGRGVEERSDSSSVVLIT